MTARSALAAAPLIALISLVAAGAAVPARADSGLVSGARAVGSFLDVEGLLTNQNIDSAASNLSGVSVSARTSCVARVNGEVACTVSPPLPTDYWYQDAYVPTYGAADAVTTFGTNHVRTWAYGNHTITTGDEGATSYHSQAQSQWTEAITYSGAPGWVTFVIRLTASWNDGGRFSAYGGVPFYNPDGADQLDGQSYHNCVTGPGTPIGCAGVFEASQNILLGGNDPLNLSGSVDQFITFSTLFTPLPFDPEDPNWTAYPVRDFIVGLIATSSEIEGAEVDAFHTMSLQQIMIPAGASISFGSGNVYDVAVVPEPGSAAMALAGLALLAGALRRRRQG